MICPSTGPVLQGNAIPARTAARSDPKLRANRSKGASPLLAASFSHVSKADVSCSLSMLRNRSTRSRARSNSGCIGRNSFRIRRCSSFRCSGGHSTAHRTAFQVRLAVRLSPWRRDDLRSSFDAFGNSVRHGARKRRRFE